MEAGTSQLYISMSLITFWAKLTELEAKEEDK